MKFKNILLSLILLLPVYSEAKEWLADSSGIQGNSYFGIHATTASFKDGIDETQGGALRIGHEFGKYIAIEGHIGTYTEEIGQDSGVDVTYGIDYLASVYLRGNLFLFDPRARIYGLLGTSYARVYGKNPTSSESTTDAELSYGIGIELYGNSRNGINLEMIKHMDGTVNGIDYRIDSVNLGYIRRF